MKFNQAYDEIDLGTMMVVDEDSKISNNRAAGRSDYSSTPQQQAQALAASQGKMI